MSSSEEGRREEAGQAGEEGGKGARGKGGGRGRKRRKSQSKKMEVTESTGASFHVSHYVTCSYSEQLHYWTAYIYTYFILQTPSFKQEDQRYCYGNYDMYYGYRCTSRGAVFVSDARIGLMQRDWFEGKDCLDIGSNTGQVRA